MHLFEGDTLSESWVVRYKSISKVGGIRWFTRYPSFWLLRAESRNFCQAEKESIEAFFELFNSGLSFVFLHSHENKSMFIG